MSTVLRLDTFDLGEHIAVDAFETFVTEELAPYFADRYRGPTRSSIADLKHQSFVKDTTNRRRYLWLTSWDGRPEALRGASFEGTRMSKIDTTEALLERLDGFGKRGKAKVFEVLLDADVPTNV